MRLAFIQLGILQKQMKSSSNHPLGKMASRLQKRANGIDYRLVDPEAAEERKSVGSSTTLPIDETELDECLKVFKWLANKVAIRLDKRQLAGTVVMIQIRTADWRNQTRSRTVLNPLYKEEDIYKEAAELFKRHWDGEPIRLLGITVSNVVPMNELHEQLSIYNFEKHAKEEKMDTLLSQMEQKFGPGSMKRGNEMKGGISTMELQFLGTGAGMPSKMRNTSSVVLNLSAEGEGYWLFDCGEATQHQILHTSLKPRKISKIFITHLHGDHIFGLPGFIGSRSFLGGEEPLDIYGPVGLEEWLKTTFELQKHI